MKQLIIPASERPELVAKIEKYAEDNECSTSKACQHFEIAEHNFYYWKKQMNKPAKDTDDDKEDDDEDKEDDDSDDNNKDDDSDSACKSELCVVFGSVGNISKLLKQLLF